MNYIYLLPFGNIDKEILENLSKDICKKLDFSTKILSSIKVPDYTFVRDRKQCDANKILVELKQLEFIDAEKILGICDVDLYSEDFNFIFGEAETPGRAAIISLYRLNKSRKIYTRVLKEAIHELGHTFGLSHCPASLCLMHFSNTVSDTDTKETDFCPKCRKIFNMLKK